MVWEVVCDSREIGGGQGILLAVEILVGREIEKKDSNLAILYIMILLL